jgi:hypothetical protein
VTTGASPQSLLTWRYLLGLLETHRPTARRGRTIRRGQQHRKIACSNLSRPTRHTRPSNSRMGRARATAAITAATAAVEESTSPPHCGRQARRRTLTGHAAPKTPRQCPPQHPRRPSARNRSDLSRISCIARCSLDALLPLLHWRKPHSLAP